MVKIAPSILSADFVRLGEEVAAVVEAGADIIHCDVMDGHFVPNISFGPLVVKAVDRVTDLPLHVHLMIEDPDLYIEKFREAGADNIIVQVEACVHLDRTLHLIKSTGAGAGVAINPATPLVALEEILDIVDLVLVMTVNPGFGGQVFIQSMLGKLRRLAEKNLTDGRQISVAVDGGIDPETAPQVVNAGARVLVAGTSIFSHSDPGSAVQKLRKAALLGLSKRA
jgi:ribulose-phosphate 3-epimerase